MSFNNTKTPNKPTTPAKWQIPTRPKYKAGKDEYYLEGELKERFCKLFPKNSNRRMMTWFGIGFSTLQRFKRELGLEKDMKAIRKQQAKDTKQERNTLIDLLEEKGFTLVKNTECPHDMVETGEPFCKENPETVRVDSIACWNCEFFCLRLGDRGKIVCKEGQKQKRMND